MHTNNINAKNCNHLFMCKLQQKKENYLSDIGKIQLFDLSEIGDINKQQTLSGLIKSVEMFLVFNNLISPIACRV